MAWTLVDSGDYGRQFADDFDSQALARFVLDDLECTVTDIRSFEFQDIRRPLSGQQRQIHSVNHREVGLGWPQISMYSRISTGAQLRRPACVVVNKYASSPVKTCAMSYQNNSNFCL